MKMIMIRLITLDISLDSMRGVAFLELAMDVELSSGIFVAR